MEPKDRIIVALDVDSLEKAIDLVELLAPHVGVFKVGLELENLMQADQIAAKTLEETYRHAQRQCVLYRLLEGKHFADKKLADIPNTVGSAMKQIARWNPKMVTVHATCGISSMVKVVENKGSVLAYAVTVLTSLEEHDVFRIFNSTMKTEVLQLARDAMIAGMDGIVCSPRELEFIKAHPDLTGLRTAVPSIRDENAPPDDQKRTRTAREAIKAGADLLVIGRPITRAKDPVAAAKHFEEEIAAAA